MCKHVADLVGDIAAIKEFFHNTYVSFNSLPK